MQFNKRKHTEGLFLMHQPVYWYHIFHIYDMWFTLYNIILFLFCSHCTTPVPSLLCSCYITLVPSLICLQSTTLALSLLCSYSTTVASSLHCTLYNFYTTLNNTTNKLTKQPFLTLLAFWTIKRWMGKCCPSVHPSQLKGKSVSHSGQVNWRVLQLQQKPEL